MRLPSAGENDVTKTLGKLSPPTVLQFEPAGRWYEAFCSRRRHKHSLSHLSADESSSDDEDDDDDNFIEDNDDMLKSLDPREWKNQDHYAVLGIGKLRYKASENQVKRAYKSIVLKHHPDKRKARGIKVQEGDDDYFTCITKAYEILGSKVKRRSYDSVDPLFDDSIPSVSQQVKDDFYQTFGPVFERNARWSNKRNVPQLGKDSDSIDDVNHFYTYWYDFDSWREFSYLDEEDKEKGENREERRWIEKQNKAARQKRKKEEMARIRQLVDNAYECDPRIQRFKDEEKQKKASLKKAKQEAARQRAEEEERIKKQAEEEERKKKEAEEEVAKAQMAAAKKEKEAQKKVLKKERKTLRTAAKEMDFFADTDTEKVSMMAEVDRLAEQLSLVRLQALNKEISCGDKGKAKAAFLKQVVELNEERELEKKKHMEEIQRQAAGENKNSEKKSWSESETKFLIQGVNVFPAGTKERWEVIANFIKQHIPGSNKSAKDVLAKAKDLQKNDAKLKQEADKKAFEKFEAAKTKNINVAANPKEGVTSERFESVGEQLVRETGTNPAPWTPEEQKLLEQALKTYPNGVAERWEKIAAEIPSRSKKDCMLRYKDLVEMIKAKKAATQAAAGKK